MINKQVKIGDGTENYSSGKQFLATNYPFWILSGGHFYT